MGAAEVSAFAEVRARKQWEALRGQLHTRFDQWLDRLEAQLQEPAPSFAQVTEAVWNLRQTLTGSLSETLVEHTHRGAYTRQQTPCPQCGRRLTARDAVRRTGETLMGAVHLERPYCYCSACHVGRYPRDEALGLLPGRIQLDVQKATVKLVTEVPDDEAHKWLGDVTGIGLGSERRHTVTHHVAEGLTVLEVAPSRDEIARRIAEVAAGRLRRPVVVLGIEGAFVPTRPDCAREHRPGRRGKRGRRALWRGQWRDAKGFRFSLLDGERIVHLLSWHQVHNEEQLGEALKQLKEAGLMPDASVRVCVVSDGAAWISTHVQALFPQACQVLDYDYCAAYLHKMAKAHYGMSLQAQEWVDATLTRLSMGKMGAVLAGLHRMRPTSEEATKAIAHCWAYLHEHRGRTHDRKLRRGGSPLGSGGIELSHKCICHVRLQRSGAWWDEVNSNHMLALRCAKYNGTLDQVFERSQQGQQEA